MENLKRLKSTYSSSNAVQSITKVLQQKEQSHILLSQEAGSIDSFIVEACFAQGHHYHVYIAFDKEEAAYVQNTIDNISEDIRVLLLPDSFRRPQRFEELDTHNILQRTEAINQLSLGLESGGVIVTYPEAIFEKVVDPTLVNKDRIDINVGDSVDLDTILELLVEYGFERHEFIYEPGQFAIRGGIVDIFSFGNEWPYRIELFDEEVESIRMFNPVDQLSVRNIKRIAIIPNVTGKFDQTDKVSLFDVFPKETILWIKEGNTLLDRLQSCFEKAQEFASDLTMVQDEKLKEIFKDRAFLYPNDIIEAITKYDAVHFRKSFILPENYVTTTLAVNPQPSFNRSFELLIEDIREKNKNGYEVYLFTENTKQIERFYSIFEDLNAKVDFHPIAKSIHEGFVDHDTKVACYTDHQIFQRFHRYKLRKGFTKEQAINLKMLRELRKGDYVVHIDHGVGKFSGLEKLEINGVTQESVRLIYKNNDILYVGINSLHKISKYLGKDARAPKLDKIGGDTWKALKRRTKKKIKDIAGELIKLYAKRKASKGFACRPDDYMQNELEASFIYEDTPDQLQATIDVKADMEKEYPMDRLICGDVGFGKTEVAIRAAFKAVVNGKQVALLVPTTILALQHSRTVKERLAEFPVKVDYINRFRTSADKTQIYKKLEAGEIDIIIGTHALLNKRVKFKDLGLLIIDEEQKFGVAAKEKLRNLKVNVDTLTLTATPIPRTLQFSLMSARDLSIIKTPPPNRQPIHTERRVFNDELIKEAIYYEVQRGGQVFFVQNRIKALADMTAMIKRLCPDVSVEMAHGQMDPQLLEKQLVNFIDHKYDVLVCTNIIETGLDISNANTMIINNAHQFGLSDLHQLRGRVGRSNKKAFCYLFAPPLSVLTPEARKRLKTLEEFSDLGSGFHIAMRDLDIRGAGNLLGGEQSGFIADIGYETYQRILEEAVNELKENEFSTLFEEQINSESHNYVRDVEIDTDIEILFPDNYINNVQERYSLYSELDHIENQQELDAFRQALIDRFGPLPTATESLLDALRLRWRAKQLGFQRVILKGGKMRCYFISNPQSKFYETDKFNRLINFISTDGAIIGYKLKQTKSYLILSKGDVTTIQEAQKLLDQLWEKSIKA